MIQQGFYGELTTPFHLPSLPRRLDVIALEKMIHIKPQVLNQEVYFEPGEKSPLLFALFRSFGKEYLLIGLLKFVADALALTGPVVLNLLVHYLESSPPEPIWHGALMALGLFAVALLNTFASVHYNYWMTNVSFKSRVAMVGAIYRKLLGVSLVSLNRYSTGEVVNFLTTDADRIVNFCPSFHEFWSMPVQIVVGLVLLFQQVGVAAFAGLAFLLLLVPVNKLIANKIGQLSSTMMAVKDARVKLMSEILLGIRSVKLLSWEAPLIDRINRLRSKELSALRGQKYLDAMCVFFWAACPALLAGITFATFVALGNKLDAAKVFTSLALFGILIKPMNAFPWVVNGLVEAIISIRRVSVFLQLPVRPPIAPLERGVGADSVHLVLEEASFSWGAQVAAGREGAPQIAVPRLVLRDITLRVNRGQMIGIVGSVGSGKTSLLLALLGELDLTSGIYRIGSSRCIGYVGQDVWLQRGTIRDNILLGAQLRPRWYRRVIEACALRPDLEAMPYEDLTQVGECGLTLSGGQRVRVALARAVYQRADLYLLDDPLSAVDTRVASHLMQYCLGSGPDSLLRRMTRILATHHEPWIHGVATQTGELIPPADWIIRLACGRMTDGYAPRDRATPTWIQSPLPVENQHDNTNNTAAEIELVSFTSDPANGGYNGRSTLAMTATILSADELAPEVEVVLIQQQDEDDAAIGPAPAPDANRHPDRPGRSGSPSLTLMERMEFGELSGQVYATYLRATGICLSVAILSSLFFMQASRNISDWWLSYWVSNTTPQPANGTATNGDAPISGQPSSLLHLFGLSLRFYYPYLLSPQHTTQVGVGAEDSSNKTDDQVAFYLIVYGGIVGTNVLLTLARAFLFAYGGVCAARTIHKKLLANVMKATVAFFDATPVGRILNRFASDMNTVDDSLPFKLNIFLADLFGLIGGLTITCYALPVILLVIVPLLLVYWSIQRLYRGASRDLKRINSIARSPLYAHFSESLSGLCVIHGLGLEGRFRGQNRARLANLLRADYAGLCASAWLSLRLQLIGVAVVTSVATVAVVGDWIGLVEVSHAGLAAAYALAVTGSMTWVVNGATETEKDMVAVERCNEFTEHVTTELVAGGAGLVHPNDLWPSAGQVEFREVSLRYRPGQPLALHQVTFTIAPGERIGIVGRTGSGKSSLLRALFRLVEHLGQSLERDDRLVGVSGQVLVDSVDVRSIGLSTLRSRLAAISQEPFLFSGTLRENLDPLGEHSDAELSVALTKCHLTDESVGTTESEEVLPLSLDRQLGEAGRELSAGQRQLICLARAMLRRARVICLDEATASVDLHRERLVQSTLSREFPTATLLVIAHRLETVLALCSRVVVMQRGRIVEQGEPHQLAQNPASLFAAMMRQSATVTGRPASTPIHPDGMSQGSL